MLRFDWSLVITVINLIVFYLLMKKFLIGKVYAVMDQRRAAIDEEIERTREEREAAEKLTIQYQDNLQNVQEETKQMFLQAKVDANTEYERIINQADEKAVRIIKEAEQKVSVEREKAIHDMQKEIAGLAIVAAAKIVGEQSSANADRQIYNQFIKETGEF